MSKVFNKQNQPVHKPKRNTFDLSYQNNLTMQMGRLYPCFCKEVLPGDTFEIDTAFGLRFMPLAFPIQTKIRADVHYFYVRNRNLWEDWPNFIGKTGSNDYVFPVLSERSFATSSLADYLGVPTTIVGANSDVIASSVTSGTPVLGLSYFKVKSIDDYPLGELFGMTGAVNNGTFGFQASTTNHGKGSTYWYGTSDSSDVGSVHFVKGTTVSFTEAVASDSSSLNDYYYYIVSSVNTTGLTKIGRLSSFAPGRVVGNNIEFDVIESFDSTFNLSILVISKNTVLGEYKDGTWQGTDSYPVPTFSFNYVVLSNNNVIEVSSASHQVKNEFPRISALPFRAYESIYNAFYRDQRNNPFIVNGVNDPNVYLPNKKGGVDDYNYDFHNRNWEQDFLTSAVPTPQQGVAPLVGLTSTGVATFADTDGTQYNVKMTTAEDGDTITGAEYTTNIPNSVARSIVNVATSGISINDFRGVNALQRWLETNMRRGFKYKDQILSHFGVDVSYAELDMPEFLGGVTQMVDIQQINQTAPTAGDPLGSYAGQASAVGSSNHTVRHYCDEHGFIIGIISIVPVPCYSQVMPKHFLKNSPLDFFFPEFGHLGLQPIKYSEVCPYQAAYNNVPLESTFGYQRAWYDYIASVDEVHGQFRTDLRDFLLGRVYNSVPSLNESFLTVSPEQLNNIFTVNTVEIDGNVVPISPILGQLHFRCIAKRPIPRYGVPRLE